MAVVVVALSTLLLRWRSERVPDDAIVRRPDV
jgi:hypothetical protein